MSIMLGLCQCGCGRSTKLAAKTNPRFGHVKGQPLRYVFGHKPPKPPMPDRFWMQVEKTDACWLWTGIRQNNKRYGFFNLPIGPGRYRITLAHRVSWSLMNGPIPPGRYVMHRCDTPLCVRPDHLTLGDHAENMADMKKKGRHRNQWSATTQGRVSDGP